MSAATVKATNASDWILMILATLLGCGGLGYLWYSDPLRGLQNATSIGNLDTSGEVRRRRSGLLVWEDLRGKAPLFIKDTLVTPPKSTGTISLDNGTVIEMAPNSMLQLKEVEKFRFEATVFYGGAKKKSVGKKGTLVALGHQNKERQKTAKKTINRIMKKISVISLVEDLPKLDNFAVGQKEFNEKLAEQLKVERELASTAELELEKVQPLGLKDYAVAIVAPSKGKSVSVKLDSWVNLKWTPVPVKKVRYAVEFSNDARFSGPLTYATKGNELSIQLTTLGRYYLRISASRGKRRILSKPIRVTVSK